MAGARHGLLTRECVLGRGMQLLLLVRDAGAGRQSSNNIHKRGARGWRGAGVGRGDAI